MEIVTPSDQSPQEVQKITHVVRAKELEFPIEGTAGQLSQKNLALWTERLQIVTEQVERHLGKLKTGVSLHILPPDSSLRALLVTTNRDAKFSDLLDGASIGALFRKRSVWNSSALHIRESEMTVDTLSHELTHLWVGQHGFRPPPVINEGLAEYVSSDGLVDPMYVEQLQKYGAITPAELYDETPTMLREYSSPKTLYASGWAVVHFLAKVERLSLPKIAAMTKFPDPAKCWRRIELELS